MNVPKLTECMGFTTSAKDGILLNYGKYSQTFLIAYLFAH